jgi:hypothetical protein
LLQARSVPSTADIGGMVPHVRLAEPSSPIGMTVPRKCPIFTTICA